MDMDFFRKYVLKDYHTDRGTNPARHQGEALGKLYPWFDEGQRPSGTILVLPTGAGKTFTAMRFLCQSPLSQGYKVLWLAHTHHLLEQAFGSIKEHLGQIAEPRDTLAVRVVSGTPGHFKVHSIEPNDDVILCTLQTATRAYKVQHPSLEKFIDSAHGKLMVVFDEAHHAPAYSYRKLIMGLRERIKDMRLLGLTATPTYNTESKRGWLKEVFPQEICYQVTAGELMAEKILARPITEQVTTQYKVEMDEGDYQRWVNSYQDIPESIIEEMANNRERNQQIAAAYAQNRDKYGKTLIFADRWYQCEAISKSLEDQGVRTGCVYSHLDAKLSTVEERNLRTRDDNAREIEKFRNDEIDVLINVRMLTEGTDVPDIDSVFLTRQTTSQILLTQMIGRALRGPKFGGTEHAYIVSFIDDWKHLINWAEYGQIGGGTDDSTQEYGKRPPVQLISIELVQRLARQMNSGININPAPYLTLLPAGWYRVSYQAQLEGTDDTEIFDALVMVFDADLESYKKFIDEMMKNPPEQLASEEARYDAEAQSLAESWQHKYFSNGSVHYSAHQLRDMFHIARHIAQQGSRPNFFPFEDRDAHDLDKIATEALARRLDPLAINSALKEEYEKPDRFWKSLYIPYLRFKSEFDACMNRILSQGSEDTPVIGTATAKPPEGPEPSEELKRQVLRRDNACLCCGSNKKLQVDHIKPIYFGVDNSLYNLQTLCRECNQLKGTKTFNFLDLDTNLQSAPADFPILPAPKGEAKIDPNEWITFIARSIGFFYQCNAVPWVRVGKRGKYFHNWVVELNHGNDPEWLRPHLPGLLQRIKSERSEVGKDGPEKISIVAPSRPTVSYPEDTSDAVEVFDQDPKIIKTLEKFVVKWNIEPPKEKRVSDFAVAIAAYDWEQGQEHLTAKEVELLKSIAIEIANPSDENEDSEDDDSEDDEEVTVSGRGTAKAYACGLLLKNNTFKLNEEELLNEIHRHFPEAATYDPDGSGPRNILWLRTLLNRGEVPGYDKPKHPIHRWWFDGKKKVNKRP